MRMGAFFLAATLGLAGVAHAGPPVVVELYTSQGCGACADSTGLVTDLAERKDILPLTFSVDYWDYLGWRDTFAKPEFAQRQRSYAERQDIPSVFTPQVIVDGVGQATANEPAAVDRLIRNAARAQRNPPDIRLMSDRVLVGSGPRLNATADVWLIRYDPRGQLVDVRRGENQGRTIGYRNVVKELVRVGGWRGKASSFDLPAATEKGLETLILIQNPKGGQVLALLND